MNEYIRHKILFMLGHGFNKVDIVDNGIVADGKYFYPFSWVENDYIFYSKICRL